jgi:phospholipid transport system substrate-binding protein
MKRLLGVAMLALGLGLGGAHAANGPREVVQQASDEMLSALRANQASLEQNPEAIYELVWDILLPHFDFQRMSQWVMGPHWRQASPAQREEFVDRFRTLLVNTYGKALLDYSNEDVVFPDAPPPSGDDVTVRSEVTQTGSAPIPITYRLHNRDGNWKVYDVTVEGVSLVTNYRSQIDSLVRREGIEGMLQKLDANNLQS